MGNPVFIDLEGGELKVNVRNPAGEELILGRVLGTYEAVMGTGGRAEGRTDGDTLRVTVVPG